VRNAFADEIAKIGRDNTQVVLLSGDIGNKLFDKFKENAEARFFNCGIAEANMMSVASGMALSGLRPVIYTITPFTTTRCFEQIRVGVSYHKAPVTIVGTGSGLSYAELGPTHHSLEDMALLRMLPGMTVLAPCDEVELRILLRQVFQQLGPVYMRIGKKGEPIIHKTSLQLRIGRAITVREGRDACIIAAGTIISDAIKAAEILQDEGISVRVISNHTVKPLDLPMLKEVFAAYPVVGVVEEHSKMGGLGGSIAEWRAEQRGKLAEMLTFGSNDSFMHEIGSQEYARAFFGITAGNMSNAIRSALKTAKQA